MFSYPILWESGVYLPEQRLWLDPRRPRPRAVISHAHSDHVAAHRVAYATPATRRLVGHRRPRSTAINPVAYGERVELDSCQLTFYPAGHVLGSAQTLLETPFGRVLYTGDLKTRPGFTSQAAPVVRADVLVLESTFGKPHYRFPDTTEVLASVVTWCRATLELGSTPVLLGYSLGKGQEVLSALSLEGFELCLHPALFAITDVYRELGCAFPPYTCFTGQQAARMVVIAPPSARKWLRQYPGPFRTAALTGWAMDRSLKSRLDVDAVFPLSDHADFEELCQFAEAVSPTMTYTVLGFDEELARHLRSSGLRAKALGGVDQLRLF